MLNVSLQLRDSADRSSQTTLRRPADFAGVRELATIADPASINALAERRSPRARSDAEADAVDARATAKRLKDNQEARRELEKDAAIYQGRLTKFKDQLSAVKTNREYQAMQHEIETAQNELGVGRREGARADGGGRRVDRRRQEGRTALAAQQKEIDAEKKTLAEELATVEASLHGGDREARGAS